METSPHGDPLLPVRRRPWSAARFETVQLNAVGWSALVSAGFAVGAGAAWITRTPLLVSLAGGLLGTWVVARALDHRRWRNGTTTIGRGDVAYEAWPDILQSLRAQGVSASYREVLDEDSGDMYPAIECRQADAATVDEALRRAAGY